MEIVRALSEMNGMKRMILVAARGEENRVDLKIWKPFEDKHKMRAEIMQFKIWFTR